ncbi:MAG: metallophosphoesterase, partial [Kiritimatiellaeota bacterium]|nr:metallophosphoesterase [Kiritimatiellota bacterium]
MKKIIISLALAPLITFAATNEFRFVQITDTHHGRTLHHQRFTNAIDRINNLPFPIEVVAHTGDFASDNLERSAEAIAEFLATITNAPLITVPGNHDFSDRGKDPAQRTTDCIESYRKHIGELGSVRETENAFYITVCTEGLFRDISESTDFDPIAFLRDALAKNKTGKPA